ELFKEILNDFIKPSWDAIREMQAGFDKNSAQEIQMSSHKLKSAAFSVGAEELGELCKDLEAAAKENNWNIISNSVPKVASIMEKVEQYISNV
ncbi:MAG: HPt (histidine-containing phosphotransfer) domain-containing protein, partial [Pseudohongiellaceae bacterium]